MNTVKENWVMYLLSLLPLERVTIMARDTDPGANDYDNVKNSFLKHFNTAIWTRICIE